MARLESRRSQTNLFKKSALCLAVLSSLGNYAVAEEATEADASLETIQVRGIRASMAENLATKRLSTSIVDAVTAEDIGKFPDKNVADSLQRVPGIVIERDGGEGSTISVRGLPSDLTFTQLNGNFIASSPGEPSRSFDYTLLPSAMVSNLEVYKSPEARLDSGGIGGTVILRTRKPLESEANSGVFSIESTYADVTDKYEPSATGVYSWKNEDEDFGLLVGLTQQTRTNRTMGPRTRNWRWVSSIHDQNAQPGDANYDPGFDANGNYVHNNRMFTGAYTDAQGNTYDRVWRPDLVEFDVTEEERERTGAQVTLQFVPTEDLELGFNYFKFDLSQDRTISQIILPEWNYNANNLPGSDVAMSEFVDPNSDTDALIRSGVIQSADFVASATGDAASIRIPWTTGNYIREESSSETFDFFGKYYISDDVTLDFVFGRTKSDGGPTENWSAAYYANNDGEASEQYTENAAMYTGYAFTGDGVDFYMDPNMLNNFRAGLGGGRDPGSTRSSFAQSQLEENYAQLDFDIAIDGDFIQSIKTGVKFRDGSLSRQTYNNFFVSPDLDAAAEDAAGQLDEFDSYQWNGGMPVLADVVNAESEGNLRGGFTTNLFPTINWARYRELVVEDWVPYTRREDNFVYEIDEQVLAGYVQFDIELTNSISGNVGVRVEKTTTDITATDQIDYLLDHNDDVDTDVQITGDARRDEEFEVSTRTNEYTKVLPSLNLKWDASDDVVVRFAASKSMSRPDYGDMGRQENLTFISQEWADDRAEFNTIPGWTGSGGNRNLQPLTATQFDLSMEYYYAESSALGMALFTKNVKNFVVPVTTSYTRPFAGFENSVHSLPAEDSVMVNPYTTNGNGGDATASGLEVFIQHAFDNGFGFNTNYTLNDSDEADVFDANGNVISQSPLIGTADYQFNFSGYFENDDFSIRASFNKRGETVLGQENGMFIYADPYDQVDVNLSINIIEDLTFTASVVNLGKSEAVSRIGNDTKARFRENLYSGRRYYAGFTYSF